MKRLLALVLALLFCVPVAAGESFAPGYAAASLYIEGLRVPYRVFSWFVAPGETIELEPDPSESEALSLHGDHGVLSKTANGWRWTGKTPGGPYPLRVRRNGREIMVVNLFVMTPADRVRDGVLDDYKIGDYPGKPLNGLAIYHQPPGFVRVTAENSDTQVSPHFRLGQFISKQADGWPHYLLLRPRLLLKLELIVEMLNAEGIRTDGLHVMSGYRTPYYNQSIGNVPYSRHVWGGAADIFVDADPVDGHMDDLNGDGRGDLEDAEFLAGLIDRRFREPGVENLVGGLAKYRANSVHGPFVHVDVRGYRARW